MGTVRKMKVKPKKTTSSPLRKLRADAHQKRLDRWFNPSSDFGGVSDPMTRTYFARDYNISQGELDHLYEGDWVSRRAVDIPAKDATREWITLQHEDEMKDLEPLNADLERLNVQGMLKEGIILDRLYGGNVLLLGAFDGQEVQMPIGTIKSVEWLANVDRFHAYPSTFYQDPEDPRFGTPELYTVQRLSVVGSHTKLVHETRLIRFEGAYLPPRMRIRNFGWGAPIYQFLRDALRQFGVSVQSASAILQDFITLKMKIGNLQELLRDNDGEEELMNRLAIIAAERSTHNIAVYGTDEEVDKMGTPTSGLPQLVDLMMDVISAAVEIPKSRFFHNQTGRLGGDAGENDLRTHYDNIASYQENDLRPILQHIIDVIAEPHGFEPGEVGFIWNPLWQLSESEMAEQYLKVAQADTAYIQNGVLEPEEVALTRFGGEGLNLTDMNIDSDRREAYLKALSQQPVDLNEPTGEEEEQGDNPSDEPDPDDEGEEEET